MAELALSSLPESISASHLKALGFKLEGSGIHTSRTMMFDELSILFSHVTDPAATKEQYLHAIKQDNCLGKRSANNRDYSAKFLTQLYGLDLNIPLFRMLRFFWQRDEKAQPLLALLCCYARDALFRKSAGFILSKQIGDAVQRAEMESYLYKLMPDHYSERSLKSIAININSSWMQAGLLTGRSKKVRTIAPASTGAVAYALALAYLCGLRGEIILSSSFTKLLDCTEGQVIDYAETASRRGWLVFNKISSVVEVQFPVLLTREEMEWVNEQN